MPRMRSSAPPAPSPSSAVGVVDGVAVARDEIATLATLPTLDALRGKLVGLLQAPATKLAQLLQAPGGQVARVVAAREKQLAESGDTA